MRLSKYHAAFLQCGSVFAVWPRLNQGSSKIRLAAHNHEIGSDAFNLGGLLVPRSRKPELYELALNDLKKLGKQSTCHQIATKLYMSSCQLFEELEVHGAGSLATKGGGRLQDYIDSFAISRAICDLETAHAIIPQVCEPFQELAMLNIMNSKGVQGIEISHEEIGQCMKGLHSDQKSWTSYNSNRDSATLLCRASRLEIDKDDFIFVTQAIINTLREINLTNEQQKADQAEADLAASKYYRSVHEHISNLRDHFLSMWNQVSEESTGVANVLIESLRKASGDVDANNLALKRILTSLMESNAEHALAQEKAIVATSGLALVARGATGAVVDFRQLIEKVGLNVTEMGLALAVMEQRHAEAIDEQDRQVRGLLKDVRNDLQSVKKITSDLKADAEKTAGWISNWTLGTLPAGPWGVSWSLLIVTPIMTVVLVGYGIPASYTRNISLAATGIVIAKFLTIAMNGQWDPNMMTPSSLSQLARDRLSSSIVTVPVEFEVEDSSTVLEDHSTILAHI